MGSRKSSDPPALSSTYSRARSVVVLSSLALVVSASLGVQVTLELPAFKIRPQSWLAFHHISVATLVFSCFWALLGWWQSSPNRRVKVSSRVDAIVSAIFAVVGVVAYSWLLFRGDISITGSYAPLFAISVLGIWTGKLASGWFVDIALELNLREKASFRGLVLPLISRISIAKFIAWALLVGYTWALSQGWPQDLRATVLWSFTGSAFLVFVPGVLSVFLPGQPAVQVGDLSVSGQLKGVGNAKRRHDAMLRGEQGFRENWMASPLYTAASAGWTRKVSTLVDEGHNPDERVNDGRDWTPLMIAVTHGHFETSKVLLEAGADPNLHNAEGRTPLMFACLYEHEDIVQLLLDFGADPNHRGFEDVIPALAAPARSGNKQIVKTLLAADADPTLSDRDHRTPIDEAEDHGNGEIAKALRRYVREAR